MYRICKSCQCNVLSLTLAVCISIMTMSIRIFANAFAIDRLHTLCLMPYRTVSHTAERILYSSSRVLFVVCMRPVTYKSLLCNDTARAFTNAFL
jgi:hypothetical protein